MGSLPPGLDPLVEREGALASHVELSAGPGRAMRRALYLGAVWAVTPLVLLEAAFRAAPITSRLGITAS